MGGRRAGSLTNLVGKGGGVSTAKSELSRAVTKENSNAIAEASAKLITKSDVGLEALRYSLKLAPFISRNTKHLAKLSNKEQDEKIRHAWSKVKKDHDLKTSPELDSTVISAAKNTLLKMRRKRK